MSGKPFRSKEDGYSSLPAAVAREWIHILKVAAGEREQEAHFPN